MASKSIVGIYNGVGVSVPLRGLRSWQAPIDYLTIDIWAFLGVSVPLRGLRSWQDCNLWSRHGDVIGFSPLTGIKVVAS